MFVSIARRIMRVLRLKVNKGTRHAEFEAITSILKSYPVTIFEETDLYVSVEPCIMCASALRQYKIRLSITDAPMSALEAQAVCFLSIPSQCSIWPLIKSDSNLATPVRMLTLLTRSTEAYSEKKQSCCFDDSMSKKTKKVIRHRLEETLR